MNKTTVFLFLSIFLIFSNSFTQAQCHIDDWTALKALYESTNSSSWINRTGWDVLIAGKMAPPSNCDLNTLYGVTTENGRVTCLDLDGKADCVHSYNNGNNLDGILPPELGKLSYLNQLVLANNKLEGSIPAALGTLTNLISCNFHNNELTGNIPSQIGNLIDLEFLALSKNKLSGNIPLQLYSLTNLKELYLKENGLTGTISSEIQKFENIEILAFYKNKLKGSLPIEMCDLTNLNTLQIHDNDFISCYPNCFNQFCWFASNGDISNGNDFDAEWEDFCATQDGICTCDPTGQMGELVTMPTNYSGEVQVQVTLSNGQNILKNDVATVYDYSTCPDYNNLENCDPVKVCDYNLAANEALWVVTKAAEYLSTYQNIEIPPVNILVNYQPEPNRAKYNATNNVIVLGAGDGIERKSMSAPDIVGHEYAHAVIRAVNNLGNYKISGAFNESYADILGELIEHYCYGFNNDWIYGSQVMVNAAGNGAGLRNLSYPKDITMKYQLPNTYKGEHWIHIDNVCFHIDNCGIHTNSGVHSYWFYLLANGGSGSNDNGYNYNINGIGIEKAAAILFDNLQNNLNPQSTFIEAREGSITAAQRLYVNQPAVLGSTIQAWDAVGVQKATENAIEFRIKNAIQTGPTIIENNQTVIPVQFDLCIDSLGMDISADELYFILHLPDTYMEMYIETVYEPLLSTAEIIFNKTAGEANIYINRLNNGASNRIVSNSSILSLKVCIVSEDVGGDQFDIAPIGISGFTKVDDDLEISFSSANLPFGFDYEDGNTDPLNKLNISLKLDHKNCMNLGAIQVEVLNKYAIGTPPYDYILKNALNDTLDECYNLFETTCQFYNLEEGNYIVEVRDSNNKISTKTFSIEFVAEQIGGSCCAENLIIPPGVVSGEFNTSGIISLSNGTTLEEVTFEICD